MSKPQLIIFVILGSVLLVALAVSFLFFFFVKRGMKRQALERDWLREHGTRIPAYVMKVLTLDHSSSTDVLLDDVLGANPPTGCATS